MFKTGHIVTLETRKKIASWHLGRRTRPVEYKDCKTCGERYEKKVSSSRGRWNLSKYCSIGCLNKSKLGKPTHFLGKIPWNKGIKWKQNEKHALNTPRGENHPAWKKDRSSLLKRNERNDSAYVSWRREVWQRDNFKCKINNNQCNGRIEAHHILSWKEYVELRYEINNGITLCHAHHPRKHSEEKRLSPYFKSLLALTK